MTWITAKRYSAVMSSVADSVPFLDRHAAGTHDVPMPLGSRSRLIGAVVVVLVVAAIGAGAGIYLLGPPRQTSDVPVPPDAATPVQVVRAYLAALNAHDCDTAKALSTAEARELTASWCHDVSHLGNVHLEQPRSPGPARSGSQGVEVIADFDLDWRLFHNDRSMSEGGTTWGYSLRRSSPTAPWRVYDQGTG